MTEDNGTPPRFAGLRRVSTERQEKQGESLSVQWSEIERCARDLGGSVVEWYGGQEHGVPGFEKKEVARLISDAQKKPRPFDAVMVTHADRWSRDNEASRAGLTKFRENGIRFFVGQTDYNLFDPMARLFLGMSAEIGDYQARSGNQRSLMARIHRAKSKNQPTAGNLPFGRTFEKGQWGIDADAQKFVQDAARRYLEGESLAKVAAEYRKKGMNHSTLHKILTKRCGPKWIQQFRSKDFNIDEAVETDVPALLPPETIQAILDKAEANKTYTHGKIKNEYLLSHVIFCEGCGYAMNGQPNPGGRLYYRHASKKRERTCTSKKGWLPAEVVEEAVIRHLFDAFGNPAAVEKAVNAAIPDLDKRREQQERLAELERLVEEEKRVRKKLLKLGTRAGLDEDEAVPQLEESKRLGQEYQQEWENLQAQLSNIPRAEEIKQAASDFVNAFKREGQKRRVRESIPRSLIIMNAEVHAANSAFDQMTFEQKRDLVQRVFSGKTPDGKRMGVYVTWLDGKETRGRKRFRFTIRGHLITRTNCGPLQPSDLDILTNPEYVHAEQQKALVTTCATQRPAPCPL